MHDYTLLQEEFPSEKNWFKEFSIIMDRAYIGISKLYKNKGIFIASKRKKYEELTESQKWEERVLSSKRMKIEHNISGLKRYRILSDRLRIHIADLYNDIIGVCAGLWNFTLTN